MKWVDASGITNWANANQRESQQLLPELIRRLVLATADLKHIQLISFPSGDAVAQGGWDGTLTVSEDSPFFPIGKSGWEFGAGQSPGTKADEDYVKRTADPLNIVPAQSTFVFVTPRPWPDRSQWASTKQKEGPWKGVRVIGANELEQWLDSAPAVALWFARKMGKPLSLGIQDIESFWDKWVASTKPEMTPRIVISGRENESAIIRDWLANAPKAFNLQGDSSDEAVAFLYTSIDGMSEPQRGAALSRGLFLQDPGLFREVIQTFSIPLIIAATGDCSNIAGKAIHNGHHVLLSIDSSLTSLGDVTRLSRPRREIIQEELISSGVSNSRAHRLSNDFGRSIPALRRHLSAVQAVTTPEWAKAEYADTMLPVLFVGAWNETSTGDRDVMSAISSTDYNQFSKRLPHLLSMPDSPLSKIGSVWTLKSHLDAWFLIAHHTSRDFLVNTLNVISSTFVSTDPRFQLPEKDRWAAGMYGKSRDHSGLLRKGLAESLVLLGLFGDRMSSVESPVDQAVVVVKNVIDSVNDWQGLASIQDILPLLAEVAPQMFLERLEKKAIENPQLFENLMKDEGNAIFGQCNHSGLLWAIESTAWSSEYFSLAVDVLQRLAEIDPGGRWANRPINSLKDIFLPSRPQTYASPEQRLAAYSRLRKSNPSVTWQFTKEYLTGGFVSEAHRFRWRDSGGERRGLEPESRESYLKYISGLSPQIHLVACAEENIVDATADLIRLPADVQDAALKVLRERGPKSFSRQDLLKINDHSRNALNWINSYGKDEHKALGAKLTELIVQFSPEDILDRVGWLLDSPWPRLPEGDRHNESRIRDAQINAAKELLNEISIKQIIAFSLTREFPGVLGNALGRVVDDNQDNDVLDELIASDKDISIFFICYCSARVTECGEDWVSRHASRLKAAGIADPSIVAALYLGLPQNKVTWSAIANESEDIERAYWVSVVLRPRPKDDSDSINCIQKLLWAERPFQALEIAGDPGTSLPTPLLVQVLQSVLHCDDNDNSRYADAMFTFYLRNVFGKLHNNSDLSIEELARLEWPFASLFDDLVRDEVRQLAIHKVLQKDPLTFAELVSLIYKSDAEKKKQPGDQEGEENKKRYRLAHNAREVFNTWRLFPGLQENGQIDRTAFDQWVVDARKKCAETGHSTGCDLQLSEMLSHAPIGSDRIWPHEAVRELIERLRNPLIEKHIPIGIYNSRGVTSRAIGEGGLQERKIAKRYREYAVSTKFNWPRTSAMLNAIADSYEADARREDTEADLDDFQVG